MMYWGKGIIEARKEIMMTDYAKKYKDDLEKFCETTDAFYRGELKVPEYKHFSGDYGSYAQRGAKSSMLRLRLCGGKIDKNTLAFITKKIEEYKVEKLHITTCQTLQLHNLNAEQVKGLMKDSWEFGIFTRGGGGDNPRNVMVSPLAGVEKGEPFSVRPYAEAAGEYLKSLLYDIHLPRKLKVAFSNGIKNEPHATFRDMGFIAKEDGTFDVYCAGGLGRMPKLGVKVAQGVEPAKILYYIRAMIEVFMEHGDYQNRAKSRTRFLQETLGVEGFRKCYEEKLKQVMEEQNLDLAPITEAPEKKGEGTLVHSRVVPQKQEGLFAVLYHPLGGDLKPEKLKELYRVIEQMEDVEIHLTPDEGMYIINCTATEAEKILAVTEDGAETEFERSVACIGNAICQVGARDSQDLLKHCIEAVRAAKFSREVLPAIHISGCPSSCGSHQTNVIGFRGGVKQTEDGPKPAFALHYAGSDAQGKEVISEDAGSIEAEKIPQFLVELGKEVEKTSLSFAEWFPLHKLEFEELAKKYTV